MKYRYTRHAVERMNERGWTIEQVEEVVNFPTLTYKNSRPDTMRHIRNGICAVVDTVAGVVITIHWSGDHQKGK